MMDDLTVAFAMHCDQQSLTYEAGIRAAERLADELYAAAEDRASFAPREQSEEVTGS
jgi:hypothetical protein